VSTIRFGASLASQEGARLQGGRWYRRVGQVKQQLSSVAGLFVQRALAGIKRPPILLGLILAGVIFGRDGLALLRLSLEQRTLDQRLAQVESQRVELTAVEEKLKNNPIYVENLIRSTFKFSAPGELVIPGRPSSPSPNDFSWRASN